MAGSFQVGGIRIRPDLMHLEREGETVPVEPKVMDALVFLAGRPDETVSRDTLRSALWPGLHVSEDALNRVVWKLRRALGDDREAPRYLATVSKRGYRLIAPVTWDARVDDSSGAAATGGREAPATFASTGTAESPPAMRSRAATLAAAAAVTALAVAGVVWRTARLAPAAAGADPPASVPFTSLDGYESAPAVSPDGTTVAFVHSRHTADSPAQLDVLVQATDGRAEAVAVTETAANEFSPAWSPDGRRLAFQRRDGARCEVVVLTLAGRVESSVAACDPTVPPGMAWTPDGDALLVAQRPEGGGPSHLARLALADGGLTVLTAPPFQDVGDSNPVISPDGRLVAFVRRRAGELSEAYVVPLDGGTARRVTFDAAAVAGLTWTPDGRALIYGSSRLGPFRLWRVAIEGGAPSLVPTVGSNASAPAASATGAVLVYEEWKSTIDVRVAALAADGHAADRYGAAPLVTSTQWDTEGRWSPDAARFAFLSDRQGTTEVWIAGPDGTRARRLTRFGVRFSSWLRWSPDGTRIALSVPVGEQFDLHVVDVTTGAVTRVTADASDERWPAWAPDADALYFGSNRSGRWEIWRRAGAGGAAVAVTVNGGLAPAVSADGRWLYYVKTDVAGLWRRSLVAEDGESRVIADVPPGQVAWDLADGGLFVVHVPGDGLPVLRRHDLTTGEARAVARLAADDGSYPEWFPSGIAVAPDGLHVAFSSIEQSGSDLWILRQPRATASRPLPVPAAGPVSAPRAPGTGGPGA